MIYTDSYGSITVDLSTSVLDTDSTAYFFIGGNVDSSYGSTVYHYYLYLNDFIPGYSATFSDDESLTGWDIGYLQGTSGS